MAPAVRKTTPPPIRGPGHVVGSTKGRAVYQSLLGRARGHLLRVIVKEGARTYHEDRLAYGLYGRTAPEIRIVEEGIAK